MTEIEQIFLWYRPSPRKPHLKVTCPMLTRVVNKYSMFVTSLKLFIYTNWKKNLRNPVFSTISNMLLFSVQFSCE